MPRQQPTAPATSTAKPVADDVPLNRPLPAFQTGDRSRRAFFVTYGASHVAKIAPVVHELRRLGVECLVMALTIGFKRAQQMGLQPVGYRDFLPLANDPAAVLERGRDMLSGNTHPEVDEEESCCYLGVNEADLRAELGDSGAALRYASMGRQCFMPVNFMGRVLEALQPGVVVATSTPRTEEAAIRAAVVRGVPTLTMVDLFASQSDPFPFLSRPVHSDRITVVSEEVRSRFLESGLRPAQVVVTGSPDFDSLFKVQARAAGMALRRRLGDPRTVVLWAGILEPEDSPFAGTALGHAVEEQLRPWVRSHPDAALIVRYHPGHYQHFSSYPDQERVRVSLPGEEQVEPLLHAADIVVHQVSTVGFQAALLHKRVLHLGFSEWFRRADFDLGSLGPSTQVDELRSLVPAIEASAAQGGARKMTVPEGPAAPRVALEVMALLNKKGAK